MSDSFDRWNNRARMVLARAQREAMESGEIGVDPTHILIVLLRDKEGICFKVLTSLGINFVNVITKIHMSHNDMDYGLVRDNFGLTEKSKQLVAMAAQEAEELKHKYVGTEHILLALTRDSVEAGKALHEQGITHERVVEEVRRVLSLDLPVKS